MTKVQVNLVVEAVDNKTSAIKVKKIRNVDEELWYGFPKDFQDISMHQQLFELQIMKTAKGSLKSRGQYRNIKLELSDELAPLYLDGGGNFVYKGFMLAELENRETEIQSSPEVSSLIGALTKISNKKESINKIVKHFLIEKFSAKNKNVQAWINQFEKECERFEVEDAVRIEAFRLCLDSSVLDWFLTMQKKNRHKLSMGELENRHVAYIC